MCSQILCSMYDFFLTRFDFKCLRLDKLVDNKVFIFSYVNCSYQYAGEIIDI
ncbi:hypothetical protein AAG906_005519 [Vitis piasezkii]